MANMKSIAEDIRNEFPETKVIIDSTPVTEDFNNEIGADSYALDPQGAVAYTEW